MSELYSHSKSPKAVREQAGLTSANWLDNTFMLEPQSSILPNTFAPIVRSAPDDGREYINMRWGFPSPPNSRSLVMTHAHKTGNGYWKPWLKREQRCLVPATSFCEPVWRSGKHVPTWFALDDSRPLIFFAGVWRSWSGTRMGKSDVATGDHLLFAFLTTEPNAEVAAVGGKAMPVLLMNLEARETWLGGSVEDALALQGPAPDGSLNIVATGSRSDAAKA